jgi:hypothetical protein
MFNYIRDDIQFVDVREWDKLLPNDKIIYRNLPIYQNYIHELVYYTDKPKHLIMYNQIESNPYHVFIYMVSRFYYFDDGHTIVNYYYPNENNTYISESALKYLPKRFVRSYTKDDKYEYVNFPGAHLLCEGVEEPWLYSYVKNLYKDIWDNANIIRNKRIYISRSSDKLKCRQIINEDSLITPLKNLGFSIYTLENMTFIDTILLFKSAEFITGYHGAGLIWLLFSDIDAIVCEIHSNIENDKHYWDLSLQMNKKYYRFLNNDQSTINISINKDEYIKILKHIMYVHKLDTA